MPAQILLYYEDLRRYDTGDRTFDIMHCVLCPYRLCSLKICTKISWVVSYQLFFEGIIILDYHNNI